jgi:alkanesulfonate monooxygenase SsuD/methylene tetrahydromethanopterin reductase-like flavin-dependent oxidoreductase (luciferase family)
VDPVRLHQDFSALDLISDGRAEIIAGRSAFLEAFALFGVDPADYDEVFTEKLALLLAIRAEPADVSYTGRYRPALHHLPVPPYPRQSRLPLWIGVGGTPTSAERAGRLGLPMVLGLIGGDIRRAQPLVEHYRAVGLAAGHPADALRLGVTSHFYVGKTSQDARKDLYLYHREYLRPKTPGGRGWLVGPDAYEATASPYGALLPQAREAALGECCHGRGASH